MFIFIYSNTYNNYLILSINITATLGIANFNLILKSFVFIYFINIPIFICF